MLVVLLRLLLVKQILVLQLQSVSAARKCKSKYKVQLQPLPLETVTTARTLIWNPETLNPKTLKP